MSRTDEIIAFLSSEDGKKGIKSHIEILTELYPRMAGLKYLAVAPSLKQKPQAILILVISEEGSYFLPEPIQESIEALAECEDEDKIYVVNSADLEILYKNRRIKEEEYDRVKHSGIKLEDLNVKNCEELQKQFDENYSKHKALKQKEKADEPLKSEESLEEKQILKKDDLKTEEKSSYQEEKDWEEQKQTEKKDEKLDSQVEKEDPEGKNTSQEKRMYGKEFPKLNLLHLRGFADEHYKAMLEEECKVIEDRLERLDPDAVKADKDVLLHLLIEKHTSKLPGENAGEVMAMIKYLLGVDPLKKSSDEVQRSFDPIVSNINFQDNNGKTALHKGAKSSAGTIYWLLRLGADPFIQDRNGETFLESIPQRWKHVKNELEVYMEKLKQQASSPQKESTSTAGDKDLPTQEAK